ncbi:RT0821/Lpp0805 family surface protein [Stappia indica]|uniref:Lipoprotein LipA n=1 Tax=Stappia indica TaxID=538381 RepID=A0A857CD97_9HYPH|nr:RT0821/Lpp0805 family surface protein [Stappia indica]QGZ36817.1 lipoprotein LipA [Stappia indica]
MTRGQARMNALKLAIAVTMAAVAGACNTGGSVGAGPVVVGGSLFGSAFSAPTVQQSEADVVLADLLRSEAGQGLEVSDRRAAATALRGALGTNRTGETVQWQNRSSGTSGRVVTGPSYQVNNILCRDYTHVVTVEGVERSMRGAACRSGEGGWLPIT